MYEKIKISYINMMGINPALIDDYSTKFRVQVFKTVNVQFAMFYFDLSFLFKTNSGKKTSKISFKWGGEWGGWGWGAVM